MIISAAFGHFQLICIPSKEIDTFYSFLTIFQRLTLVWQAELCHGEVNAAR